MTIEEKIMNKMQKCGHFLHHSREVKDLKFLTEEEKQNLDVLLSKCLEKWNN